MKEHAWKACIRGNRIEGSNPSLSAILSNQPRCAAFIFPADCKSGSCAMEAREPCQVRKEAAISGYPHVPQGCLPLQPAGKIKEKELSPFGRWLFFVSGQRFLPCTQEGPRCAKAGISESGIIHSGICPAPKSPLTKQMGSYCAQGLCASLQNTSSTFPGFRISSGSRARLMVSIMYSSPGSANWASCFTFLAPMPCSPLSFPPRA